MNQVSTETQEAREETCYICKHFYICAPRIGTANSFKSGLDNAQLFHTKKGEGALWGHIYRLLREYCNYFEK